MKAKQAQGERGMTSVSADNATEGKASTTPSVTQSAPKTKHVSASLLVPAANAASMVGPEDETNVFSMQLHKGAQVPVRVTRCATRTEVEGRLRDIQWHKVNKVAAGLKKVIASLAGTTEEDIRMVDRLSHDADMADAFVDFRVSSDVARRLNPTDVLAAAALFSSTVLGRATAPVVARDDVESPTLAAYRLPEHVAGAAVGVNENASAVAHGSEGVEDVAASVAKASERDESSVAVVSNTLESAEGRNAPQRELLEAVRLAAEETLVLVGGQLLPGTLSLHSEDWTGPIELTGRLAPSPVLSEPPVRETIGFDECTMPGYDTEVRVVKLRTAPTERAIQVNFDLVAFERRVREFGAMVGATFRVRLEQITYRGKVRYRLLQLERASPVPGAQGA